MPEFRSLKDLVFAKADGEEVSEDQMRVYRREEELVRAALAFPRAFEQCGIHSPMLTAPDYRTYWAAFRAAVAVHTGDGPLRPENVLSEMQRLDSSRFLDPGGRSWMHAITSQPSVDVGYALEVLVPEVVAKHLVAGWGARFTDLSSRIPTAKDVLSLHQEFITEGYRIGTSPDGGRLGDVLDQMVWDENNRNNANIVPTGIPQIDRNAGGGHGRGELLIWGGGTATGKCHQIGQGILMYDGTIKRVEDIRVGDRLMGPASEPRTVLSTNSGSGEMFEVRPVSPHAQRWRVNEEHVLTLVGTGDPEKTRWGGQIIDVSVKEWMTWNKKRKHNFKLFMASSVDFEAHPDVFPIEPYFMGVLLGDGGWTTGTPNVTTIDPEIVTEVYAQAAKFGLDVSIREKSTYKTAPTYAFVRRDGRPNSDMLARAMDTLGMRSAVCGTKFIPQIYKTASREARLEILAGLMDTDGSAQISKWNGAMTPSGYDFISKSQRLAEDVVFIARSLGMRCTIRSCRKGCQTGAVGTYYRVCIYGEATTLVPCRIPRKRLPPTNRRTDATRSGFTVVPTGETSPYFGFTLDGDGRYLIDDFTVTHNSYGAQRLLRNQPRMGRTTLYISVEDSAELMFCRMVADYSDSTPKLRPVDIRDRSADPLVVRRSIEAMAAEQQGRVYNFSAKKWTVSQICAVIRRHRYMANVDLVIVDYLQAVQPDSPMNNRVQETAAVVSQLKKCASDCGVALVLMSQYSREEYKDGQEPSINACKYAGDIENEAEIMVLMWRDEDDNLHAKMPKVKWAKGRDLRYIIPTDPDSGAFGNWQDDFTPRQPAVQKKQWKGKGGGVSP